MNFLYAFCVLIVAKIAINLSKFVKCKSLLRKYRKYLQKADFEIYKEKSKFLRLLKDAGVEDAKITRFKAAGYGQIQATTPSVQKHFGYRDSGFASATVEMFHEAIGFYRDRLLETFNPVYWIEAILYLPRKILAYLGLSTESLATRILQLIYWLLSAVGAVSYAVYKDEIDQLVRGLIGKILP